MNERQYQLGIAILITLGFSLMAWTNLPFEISVLAIPAFILMVWVFDNAMKVRW